MRCEISQIVLQIPRTFQIIFRVNDSKKIFRFQSRNLVKTSNKKDWTDLRFELNIFLGLNVYSTQTIALFFVLETSKFQKKENSCWKKLHFHWFFYFLIKCVNFRVLQKGLEYKYMTIENFDLFLNIDFIAFVGKCILLSGFSSS